MWIYNVINLSMQSSGTRLVCPLFFPVGVDCTGKRAQLTCILGTLQQPKTCTISQNNPMGRANAKCRTRVQKSCACIMRAEGEATIQTVWSWPFWSQIRWWTRIVQLEHITQNVQDTNTEGWWFTRPACCINGSLPCHFDTWTSGGSNFPRNSKLVHSCVICLVSCTSVLAITFKKTVQSSIHSWSDMADICLNMLEHFRMMGPGWKVKKLKAPIRITVHHPWQHQEHGGNAQVQVCLFHRLGNK